MYKIFFEDREFIICDKIKDNYPKPDEENISTEINTFTEMEELITNFEYFNSRKSVSACVDNVEDGFKWFSNNFIWIEAAGGLAKNSNNEYLLIYRFNHWDLPKGKREANETAEETALREVEEECSLNNLYIISHIIDTYHTYSMNGKLYLKKTYWYEMEYNGIKQPYPQIEEGIEKVIWVPKAKLNEYSNGMYKSICEVIMSL